MLMRSIPSRRSGSLQVQADAPDCGHPSPQLGNEQLCPDLNFPLRSSERFLRLCGEYWLENTHRGDAEIAEEAQRISNQDVLNEPTVLPKFPYSNIIVLQIAGRGADKDARATAERYP